MKVNFFANIFKRSILGLAFAVVGCSFTGAAEGKQVGLANQGAGNTPPKPNVSKFVANPSLSRPDLVMRNLRQTGRVTFSGGYAHIPIQVTVRNSGTMNVEESTLCGIRIGDKFVWSTFINPLPVNSSQTKNGTIKVKHSPHLKLARRIVLEAVADAAIGTHENPVPATGRVFERNEGNNQRHLVVKWGTGGNITHGPGSGAKPPVGVGTVRPPNINAAKPDYKITAFNKFGNVRYNGVFLEVPFQVVIRNMGRGNAKARSSAVVEFENQIRWTKVTPAMGSGQIKVATGLMKLYDPNKKYRGKKLKFRAMADFAGETAVPALPKWGRVREGNERNNSAMMAIQVPAIIGGGLASKIQQTSGRVNPKVIPNRRPTKQIPVRRPRTRTRTSR